MDTSLLYQMALLFFVYAFLGWCCEVVFHAVVTGHFVNRGFLNGPWCPIYGIGVLLVITLLRPFHSNGLLLFFFSIILTSVLEFLTGLVLDKLFHARWWDYSDEPFHIGPYVCLRFSLLWGLACVFVVYLLHPVILGMVEILPMWLGITLLVLLLLIFIADIIVSVNAATKILNRLEHLDELAEEIHSISDRIGLKISDSTLEVMEKGQQSKERLEEYKEQLEEQQALHAQKLEEKKAAYQKKLAESPIFQRRMLSAFPNLKPKKHQDILEALREAIKNRKEKK